MNKIIIFFVVLNILSCNKDKKQIPKSKFIIHRDSISIDTPKNINPMEVYWQFIKTKNISYLIDTDIPLNNLFIYDLQHKKWQTLNFTQEGPNGIGIGTGFYYYNKDSIFIVSGYQNKIFLFNKNIQKIKEYKIPKSFDINLYTIRKGFINNSKLFIPFTSFIKKDKRYTKNSKLLLKIDINTGNTTPLIKYPNSMLNKKWNTELLQMSYLIEKDTIYSSFCALDSIFLYDLKGKLICKKYAKSKYLDHIEPLSNNVDSNSYKAKNKLYQNGFYGGLISDTKYFYRLAYHLPKNFTKKNITRKNLILSVLIFNKNLEFLNEIILKKGGGYYHFITEKGLTVSANPNFTENLTEGKRKFYTYKFEKI